VAAHLKQTLGVDTELVRGSRGAFKVYVGDTVVAKKTLDGFPTPEQCEAAVRAAL
jgi:hypothetical protein